MNRTAIYNLKIFFIIYIVNVVAIESLFIYMNIREIKAKEKDMEKNHESYFDGEWPEWSQDL